MVIKEIDEIDKNIIKMLQNEPSITHSEIAKQLNRSQPAIGARIKKLEDKGVLTTQIGVVFNKLEALNLIKLEFSTSDPQKVIDMARECPYIINVIKTSGKLNIMLFMACSSLKRLDYIIDRHFRTSIAITNIRMDLVTGFAKKFIQPISFCIEDFVEPDDECKCCEENKCHFGNLLE